MGFFDFFKKGNTDGPEVNAEASPAEAENMQEGLQDTPAPEEAAPNAPVKFTPEQLAERKAQLAASAESHMN